MLGPSFKLMSRMTTEKHDIHVFTVTDLFASEIAAAYSKFHHVCMQDN